MSEVGAAMDTMADALRAAAGPELFHRNAFRITGLPTTADRIAVHRRHEQASVAGHPADVDPADVRDACERLLEDPRRRLIDELFWLWEVPGGGCECATSLHEQHDRAVIMYGRALDRELRDDSDDAAQEHLWSDASRRWDALLRDEGLYEHLLHRVRALDNARLPETVVDEIRAGLPATLLQPLVMVAVAAKDPARAARFARNWPGRPELAEDLLARTADPLYGEVEAVAVRVRALLEAGVVDSAIDEAKSAMGTLTRLRVLLPATEHRRTAHTSELIAVAFNNCASRLYEQSGPLADRFAELFPVAAELAVTTHTRQTISENRQIIGAAADQLTMGVRLVRQFADAGQPVVAGEEADRLRRELAEIPGAVAEIDRTLDELRERRRLPETAGSKLGSWLMAAVLITVVLAVIMVLYFPIG
ncbi:hypothetical protein AB0M54_38105 [Actinoplanes sp. NPDC051470]|uniref:hypothetical protein n=1 Tax=Actinoplanes sp. NPDC051470 TaxID=3157224 RepID=UPI003415C004